MSRIQINFKFLSRVKIVVCVCYSLLKEMSDGNSYRIVPGFGDGVVNLGEFVHFCCGRGRFGVDGNYGELAHGWQKMTNFPKI